MKGEQKGPDTTRENGDAYKYEHRMGRKFGGELEVKRSGPNQEIGFGFGSRRASGRGEAARVPSMVEDRLSQKGRPSPGGRGARVVPRLYRGCPAVVPRLSRGCPAVVPRLSRGCPVVVLWLSRGCLNCC